MKNNLDYYPHFREADRNAKFKALRAEYGWAGEGRFWALNNRIADADGCWLDLSKEYKLGALATDLDFARSELEQFLTFLAKNCELIIRKDGKITTEILQETLSQTQKKRTAARMRWERRVCAKGGASPEVRENEGFAGANTSPEVGHRVKERKGKESKENNTARFLADFVSYWNALGRRQILETDIPPKQWLALEDMVKRGIDMQRDVFDKLSDWNLKEQDTFSYVWVLENWEKLYAREPFESEKEKLDRILSEKGAENDA